jgi:hypothetical protein
LGVYRAEHSGLRAKGSIDDGPLHHALQLLGMCIGGELRLVRGDGHLSGHQGLLLPVAVDHIRNPDWLLPPTALLTILYDVMVLLA